MTDSTPVATRSPPQQPSPPETAFRSVTDSGYDPNAKAHRDPLIAVEHTADLLRLPLLTASPHVPRFSGVAVEEWSSRPLGKIFYCTTGRSHLCLRRGAGLHEVQGLTPLISTRWPRWRSRLLQAQGTQERLAVPHYKSGSQSAEVFDDLSGLRSSDLPVGLQMGPNSYPDCLRSNHALVPDQALHAAH